MTYRTDIIRQVRIIGDVIEERERQEAKGRQQAEVGSEWTTCADPDMPGGDDRRFLVLAEEVGEVANAILENRGTWAGDGHLRMELVQVAAVAVAFIEAIDERGES